MQDISFQQKEKTDISKHQLELNLADIPHDEPNDAVLKTTVYHNLFPLKFSYEYETIYIYHLDFYNKDRNEEIPNNSRDLKRQIFKIVKPQITEKLGVTNFRGNNCLALKEFENLSFDASFNGTNYQIKMKKPKFFDLRSGKSNYPDKKIQYFVNTYVKNLFQALNFKEKGRTGKYFENKTLNQIPYFRLEVFQGFLTSTFIPSLKNPKLLIDCCSRILRTETALEKLKQCNNENQAKTLLVGFSVTGMYGNRRNFHIVDIAFDKNINQTFECNREQMSYKKYFDIKYGIKLKDDTQPLLVSIIKNNEGEKCEIYLPPEICQMTGLSDEDRKNYKLMQEVANFTRLSPAQRVEAWCKIAKNLNQAIQGFNLEIGSELPKLNANILPKPQIFIKNDIELDVSKDNFDIQGPLLKPMKLKKGQWILAYPANLYNAVDEFCIKLSKAGEKFGILVEEPIWVEIQEQSHPQIWADKIGETIEQFGKPSVIITYSDRKQKDIYNCLKKVFVENNGCIHQHVLNTSFNRGKMSVCSNILLQINAKRGYALYKQSLPDSLHEKIMVVGINLNSDNKKTIVGVVSSLDSNLVSFHSQIKIQDLSYNKYESGQEKSKEIIQNIQELIKNSLEAYYKKGERFYLPECIFIYRDGVGDSQRIQIQEKELKQLLYLISEDSDLKDANNGKLYKPQLAFITINKRINQKFFSPIPDKYGNPFSNPQPGTVIDQEITQENKFQFYLINQFVNQGSCTPTFYNVLYNSTKLTKTDFYLFTYWQSYNYFNWRGPIRVPAPVMYAYKLAFLYNATGMKKVNEKIKQKLFFL